ncbi:hypothetical protein P171DRAFT_467617 [Karstenula rhodostoma CBS 690.94]|uniref:Calcineurin-like phosphoesterase domain-containing protein n=1 Tax=Karstenula rhodostoma CBS 690.94 TaxID=1392251 RepID=A0A9P4P6B9_9PLEO|nr:hypothetical protein P171DRAFT_467617 [Karstenula rhodostoma CBS 690.94]
MQLSRIFFVLALVLAPVALVGTTWLYLYPFFDAACAFPSPPGSTAPAPFRLLALGDPQLEGNTALRKVRAKVFRSFDNILENVRDAETVLDKWQLVRDAVKGIPKDLVRALEGYVRKPIDIWGNDWYLAHIVRTLRWWTEPSHVAVLGDLLGSQWINNEEFERRSRRYWDVVFRGLERVPDRIMTGYQEEEQVMEQDKGEEKEDGERPEREKRWGGTVEVLGQDASWANRAINIAGNHDIGYAGDIDVNRVERFERTYGKVNWDIIFTLPNNTLPDSAEQHDAPALRLVILNTMNLDTPAFDGDLQRETYDFINHVIITSRSVNDKTHATVLLTHIPLHKEPGVCVDSPFFDFFDGGSGVKEQNMLSEHASKTVLESVFGLNSNQYADGQGFGRRGIIVNGHDHAGCDVLHYTTQPGVDSACPENVEREAHLPHVSANTSTSLSPEEAVLEDSIAANDTLPAPDADLPPRDQDSPSDSDSAPSEEGSHPTWHAQRLPSPPYTHHPDGSCTSHTSVPRIREVTLRSMMGEFEGYAGFLSAWFDTTLGEKGEWVIEVNTCGVGVQHWWWGVHVVDFIFLLALVAGAYTSVSSISKSPRASCASHPTHPHQALTQRYSPACYHSPMSAIPRIHRVPNFESTTPCACVVLGLAENTP